MSSAILVQANKLLSRIFKKNREISASHDDEDRHHVIRNVTHNGINENNKRVCFDTHYFETQISCKTQLWKRRNDAVNDYLVVKAKLHVFSTSG